MRLTNTLTRTKELFTPADGQTVKLYTCGPTVYHYAHIGNLRNVVFNDTLRRALEAQGWDVKHVMNITDVGHLTDDGDGGTDKMEKGAAAAGKTPEEVAAFYTEAFWRNVDSLGTLRPTSVIPATSAIDSQINMIKILLEKGFAYIAESAIYFDVSKQADYGKLTGQALTDKEVGVRANVVTDDEKRNPQDFALWFFLVGHHADHSMHWPSPWGEGFPGWHLECSAIAHQELGEPLDIHTGGVDHIGTHHTNEIAQSEAAFGHELARFWLHNEFLQIDGEKMAKSGGNGYTLDVICEKGYNPLALRVLFLQAHYRSQQNFTWMTLRAANNYLQKLWAFADLKWQTDGGLEAIDDQLEGVYQQMLADLSDDLNTPAALASLSKLMDQLAKTGLPAASAERFQNLLEQIDALLGLQLASRPDIEDDIKQLIAEREEVRLAKDFTAADKLRAALRKKSIAMDDKPTTTRWHRLIG